jgi:hypothetical protein
MNLNGLTSTIALTILPLISEIYMESSVLSTNRAERHEMLIISLPISFGMAILTRRYSSFKKFRSTIPLTSDFLVKVLLI